MTQFKCKNVCLSVTVLYASDYFAVSQVMAQRIKYPAQPSLIQNVTVLHLQQLLDSRRTAVFSVFLALC